jgi:hypothetical protein
MFTLTLYITCYRKTCVAGMRKGVGGEDVKGGGGAPSTIVNRIDGLETH